MRRLRHVWTYRRGERPYIFLGVLCVLAGLGGLAAPAALGASAVAQVLSITVQRVWLACYLLGGVSVLTGTMWAHRPREDFETLGLHLILGGMAVHATVLLAIRGPVAALPTLLPVLFAGWMIHGRLQMLRGEATLDPWDRRARPRA